MKFEGGHTPRGRSGVLNAPRFSRLGVLGRGLFCLRARIKLVAAMARYVNAAKRRRE